MPYFEKTLSTRIRWLLVLFVTVLHPLLLYSLTPIFGPSINAIAFFAPVTATLAFGLRTGLVFCVITVASTGIIFSRLLSVTAADAVPRVVLSIIALTLACIGAARARHYFIQRTQAETALKDRESLYRLIFEGSAEGIICLDREGTVLEANRQASTQLSISHDRLIGARLAALSQLSPDSAQALSVLIKSQSPPKIHEMEIQGTDADGGPLFVDLNLACVEQQGNPIRFIGMLKNTTERRHMERQLQDGKRIEALGRLAGGVAHDINNILGAITASAVALRNTLSTDRYPLVDIENITNACDRGAELTRNLLGFARKGQFKKQPFSLNDVVTAVLMLLHRTTPKGIRIVSELEERLPLIDGDQGQMENAVMNLCLNAIDAMETKGQLTLTTRSTSSRAAISVSDTGIGINDEIKGQVFEPFFTTKPIGKGTGLGLSMVYGVVRAHSGEINFETGEEKGTTMTATFPITGIEKRARVRPRVPNTPSQRDEVLRDQTVLLVDDEPLVLRAGIRMLRSLGCTVLSADNGKRALQIFCAEPSVIDLVILDLIMPEMDGAEVLQQLTAIDEAVPVLLVSGYTPLSQKIEPMTQQHKNCGFLSKPYNAKTLLEAVERLTQSPRDHDETLRKRAQ